jgi:hypothetical protein
VGAWKGTNEEPGKGMAVGTPPGVAANTNPGANNPADMALETSHLDIGEGMDTGSGAGVGTTEGSG